MPSKRRNKKKRNNAAPSTSGSVPLDNKTPKELKAKGKLAKRSSNLHSAQIKEAEKSIKIEGAEIASQSQPREKEKAAKDGSRGNNYEEKDAKKSQNMNRNNKEKESTSQMSVNVEKDGKTKKTVGGMIFMCNAKTKADCFSYSVMGVSANKKDVIMGIKPGVKIFLFDFDLKLLYGIYEASSAGGMKLEPAAFGGAFPAQVRFRIVKDCLPLPENVFKIAIKDSYDERTHKFKTELTFNQVERLRKLFKPAPWLHQASKHSVSEPVIHPPSAAPLRGEEPLREPEYETGYRRSKEGENFPSNGHERQQHASHHIMPREVERPLFLSEKEYRSYGLQSAKHLQPTGFAVVDRTLDHIESEQGREQARRNLGTVSSERQQRAGHHIIPSEVERQPHFLSEKEYRSYGLQSAKHLEPTASAVIDHTWDHNESEQGRERLRRNPGSVSSERQQHAGHHIIHSEVERQPSFLSEKEYRSYGLQSAKHLQPTASAVTDHRWDHNESEQGRERLRRNPGSGSGDAALARKETGHTEPLFPSEREYRTYGLKGRSELPASVAPAGESSATGMSATPTYHGLNNHVGDTYNPYDESTASLVNRYLSLPRTVLKPTESYPYTGRVSFARDPYSAIDIRGHMERFHTENVRAYSPYASHVPPDYDMKYHYLRDGPRYSSNSVSSLYSYGGPSAPRR